MRDYIHVSDLASGHVAALNWMNGKTGVEIFNLGTGTGTSVLEVVAAFSKACGCLLYTSGGETSVDARMALIVKAGDKEVRLIACLLYTSRCV